MTTSPRAHRPRALRDRLHRRRVLLTLPLAAALLLLPRPASTGVYRWRSDGNSCVPRDEGSSGWSAGPYTGGSFSEQGWITGFVICPIPTAAHVLETDSASTERVDFVSALIDLQGPAGVNGVIGWLRASDADSSSWCECDREDRVGNNGIFSMTLDYDGDAGDPGCDECPGWAPADYQLTAQFELQDTIDGKWIRIKRLQAYDI